MTVIFNSALAVIEQCKTHHWLVRVDRNSNRFVSTQAEEHFQLQIGQAKKNWEHDSSDDGLNWFSHTIAYDPGNSVLIQKSTLDEMNRNLQDEESDIRKISSWPVDKTFLYLDFVEFSKSPLGVQNYHLSMLMNLVEEDSRWQGAPDRCGLLRKICIGDGYVYIFKEPILAASFAVRLGRQISTWTQSLGTSISCHFRMGLHYGPVLHFWEKDSKMWNYLGDGINGGQRVLSAIGKEYKDQIYISKEAKQRIEQASNQFVSSGAGVYAPSTLLNKLFDKGIKKDKHKRSWHVYELDYPSI